MLPKLPHSYKNRFPFRLAAPSYIYPGDYLFNIQKLGPFVDEIELLFFECLPENSPPSNAEIQGMDRLSRELSLTYNVHLPTDISISDPDSDRRKMAVETLQRLMDSVSLLAPATMTLHIDYNEKTFSEKQVKKWRKRVEGSLERLLSTGVDGKQISIETLDYPFEIIEGVIRDYDLSICLDLGHLVFHGRDIQQMFDRHRDRISIIHLHGVANGRDHLGLDAMEKKTMIKIIGILKQFSGSVCLETFSYEKLRHSLETLEKFWG